MIEHLTAADFKARIFDYATEGEMVFRGQRPCIVDFYADWCGPCRMVAPVLEDLARQYEGLIDIYKINTDEEPELAGVFNIRSIPTILFVPLEGQPQAAMGALPKATFIRIIEDVFKIQRPGE